MNTEQMNIKKAIERRFYSVDEISRYLGVSSAGVRKWIRCECIPFHKINGSVRFDIQEIDRWAREKH
jgi:excisionase family DNA binding protein